MKYWKYYLPTIVSWAVSALVVSAPNMTVLLVAGSLFIFGAGYAFYASELIQEQKKQAYEDKKRAPKALDPNRQIRSEPTTKQFLLSVATKVLNDPKK